MIRTQIYLTNEEREGISTLAKSSGKKQSEIIRDAIDAFLSKVKPENKLQKLRKAKGLWKKRLDIDIRGIRKTLDRF